MSVMLVKYRHWVGLGILTVFGAWVLAPVGSTAGEYILDGYKEVQVYLEEYVGDVEIGFGSIKGGEIR